MTKIPIYGWEAELMWVKDDSSPWYKKKGEITSIIGELYLLPDQKNRWTSFFSRSENLSLDTFFRCFKNHLIIRFLDMDPGTTLFVTGSIDKRYTGYPNILCPYLTTSCLLEDAIIDKSNGKVAAEAALLFTADIDEFISLR